MDDINYILMDDINYILNEYIREQMERKEKSLVDMIQNYDFIVGSTECMHKLQEILPKDCEVIYTPYIYTPSAIYAIKRYNLNDLRREK